jgi:hypothetical protein
MDFGITIKPETVAQTSVCAPTTSPKFAAQVNLGPIPKNEDPLWTSESQ